MSGVPAGPGRAHAPRPADLVALVTFGGEVYENQAVTRERLARPTTAPHPLNATIEQWLGRRRHIWIDVHGRQINGIATARTLAANDAWMIDTLVDASDDPGRGVTTALLRQAAQAATRQGVTRLLLRTRADSPALPEALRTGFKPALNERLWRGGALRASAPPAGVREKNSGDTFALFQLYNRAFPIDGRQALALTLEEWEGVQECRWLGRGSREFVAVEGDRAHALLRVARSGKVWQFDLLADGDGAGGADALLDAAAERFAGAAQGDVIALVPRCAAPLGRLLRERGMEEGGCEYALLSMRLSRPVEEQARSGRGVAVSRGV